MIYKRVAARLKAQDWVAIMIELGIVILGVYIGTWVANRNQQSAERGDTLRLVDELRPPEIAHEHARRKIRKDDGLAKKLRRDAREKSEAALIPWPSVPRPLCHA